MFKWGLVIAGIKDLGRPAEKLSVSQNVGEWSPPLYQSDTKRADRESQRSRRPVSSGSGTPLWSVASPGSRVARLLTKRQITPVNYSLASVNTFVGATGITQLYRIWE